ncbi:hypothetical protein DFH09DRAFT_1080118 [Mycena vulgaris]|nr:hypothetical protein DFH09DRAFT_1080118 [Mycena vulgaris]
MAAAPCTRLALRHASRAFYAKQLGILRKINDTEQTEMVGLPVGRYVYGMWVSMQHVDKAVGEETRKVGYVPLSHPFRYTMELHRMQSAGPFTVANATYGEDFVATRDNEARDICVILQRSLSRGSLFSFTDIADDNDPAVLHRSRGLNAAHGAAVWRDRLRPYSLKVLHEIISIEEESKGGVLRESWFQSTLDIPVEAEENTFLLYVMAPSAGIHSVIRV